LADRRSRAAIHGRILAARARLAIGLGSQGKKAAPARAARHVCIFAEFAEPVDQPT
jgi:hypothetical protein